LRTRTGSGSEKETWSSFSLQEIRRGSRHQCHTFDEHFFVEIEFGVVMVVVEVLLIVCGTDEEITAIDLFLHVAHSSAPMQVGIVGDLGVGKNRLHGAMHTGGNRVLLMAGAVACLIVIST
jgi:hypothetical protein